MTTTARKYIIKLYTPHVGQIPIHASHARFRVICCGRRWGKTTFAANDEMKFALDNAEVLCWWVAPTARQAKIAYRLMKRALRDITERHNDTDMRLELANGSVIECRSCDDPDNLRGEGIHYMVVEEAAMLPDATWYGVLRPMLSDTNGKAVFIFTPKGYNWCHTLYQRGLDPLQPDYESFSRPTSTNPYIDPKEIEDAKHDLPEDFFEQEYLALFKENGAGAFKNIDGCIAGTLLPASKGMTYEIGFDVAKHRDFSVMSVFNVNTQHLDWYYRVNHTDYTVQIDTLKELSDTYNAAHVLMDCTGVGAAVMEMVKGRGIPVDGFLYTNTSKAELIGEMIVGMQHRAFTYPDIPVLIGELRAMQIKYSPSRLIQYEAPAGGTDDFVNSLGLAYRAGKTALPIALVAAGSHADTALPVAHETDDERLQARMNINARVLRQVLGGQFGR